MFNVSTDRQPTPITEAQSAYLGRLILKHGKSAYLAAKQRAGVPVETTLLKLSKAQAAKLIRAMITVGRR